MKYVAQSKPCSYTQYTFLQHQTHRSWGINQHGLNTSENYNVVSQVSLIPFQPLTIIFQITREHFGQNCLQHFQFPACRLTNKEKEKKRKKKRNPPKNPTFDLISDMLFCFVFSKGRLCKKNAAAENEIWLPFSIPSGYCSNILHPES